MASFSSSRGKSRSVPRLAIDLVPAGQGLGVQLELIDAQELGPERLLVDGDWWQAACASKYARDHCLCAEGPNRAEPFSAHPV